VTVGRPIVTSPQTLGLAGTVAALLGVLGALGCCGLAILGFASAGGALALVPAAWAYELLYASLGLAVLSLAANRRRHGRTPPLALGIVGALALLLAFHEAWDVAIFRLLVGSGGAALLAAVGTDLRISACHLAGRRADMRAPIAAAARRPEAATRSQADGRQTCAT